MQKSRGLNVSQLIFAKIQNSGLGENFSWTLVMAFELFRSDVNEDRSLQRLLVILNNVM